MRCKKLLTFGLVLVQFTGFAFADPSPSAPSVSPEMTLLEQVITLQGSEIQSAKLQQEVATAVSAYIQSSPVEGRSSRMEQAMIDLGMYTPAQAKSFVQDIADAQQELGTAKPNSTQQISSFAFQQTQRIVAMHPAGAEFSTDCSTGGIVQFTIGSALFIGGIVFAAAGGDDTEGTLGAVFGFFLAFGAYAYTC